VLPLAVAVLLTLSLRRAVQPRGGAKIES